MVRLAKVPARHRIRQGSAVFTGHAGGDYVVKSLGAPMDELQQFPKYVYIETTNQCNARCSMCGAAVYRKKPSAMSDSLFRAIVGQLAPWAPHLQRVALFLDGEPLLDKKLEQRIIALKEAGIRQTYISTNASLLFPKRAEGLIRAGLDLLHISMDSMVKSTYESIRKGLKYDDVYRNTVEFIRLRNKINPNLVIRVQMIEQNSNRGETKDFLAHWRPLLKPHDVAVVVRSHNWGGAVNVARYSDADAAASIPCIALWSTLVIRTQGGVRLCCIDVRNSVSLGHLSRHSIAGIWRGKKMQRIRQMHLQGQRDQIPICRCCTAWHPAKHVASR